MSSWKQIILFVVLLQLQLFSVYSTKDTFIAGCKFNDAESKVLTFVCGEEESNNKLDEFISNDFVWCNTKRVELKTVKYVQFTLCHFKILPGQLLSKFSNLKGLNVGSIGLTAFHFDDLPNEARQNLRFLNLGENNFTHFDPAPLRNMPNLEKLNLFNSNIKQLGQFPALPKLNEISLMANKIKQIPITVFANLANLEDLGLSQNKLTSAELQFPEPNQLRSIQFSMNKIKVLRVNDFVKLKNLKELKIAHSLEYIEPGAFAHLVHLQLLDLSGSYFTQLHAGDIGNLKTLEELRINGGALTTIEPDALSQLPNLQKLDIGGNRITEIHQDTFKGLANLNALNLGQNRLTSAAVHFDEGNNLQHLDLSGNWIVDIRTGDFVDLMALKHLILERSYQYLANIELGTFSTLLNLEILKLSYNNMYEIDFNLFAPSMDSLTTLKLDGNHLSQLHDNFDELFPKLESLVITGNPFNCTYLGQFLRTLRSNSSVVNDNNDIDHNPNINGIKCKHALKEVPPGTTPDGEGDWKTMVKHGFHSGYNVSLFVLLLWIGLTNIVICGAIVLVARKWSRTT